MSWKDEIRKKDKESDSFKGDYYTHGYTAPDKTRYGKTSPVTAKRTKRFPYLDEIEIKDKDGNKLTSSKKMALISVLQDADFERHKEILDEANVDMREFTKFLYKVKLPFKRKQGKGKDAGDYPAF